MNRLTDQWHPLRAALFALASIFATGAAVAAASAKIALEGEYVGHLQDIWMEGGSIWWAHTEALVKTDMSGKILVRAEVGGHHAGLQVKDGHLFTAVCAINGEPRGSTTAASHVTIGEYDADTLKLIEMHVLDINDRSGSFCFLEDGTMLVGCLRHPSLKPNEVKFHHLDRNYKLIKTHVVDVGRKVPLGIEVIRRDGDDIFLFIYGGPVMRLSAKTLEVTGRLKCFGGQCGFKREGAKAWIGETSASATLPNGRKGYKSWLVRKPCEWQGE